MSFLIQPPIPERLNRCQLFGPGSRPELFEKMASSQADVINLDLEDSVAPPSKVEARQNISKAVRRANSRLTGPERVRHFHIINDEFTIENKMLTPTLKVRRHIVSKIYKSKLDTLYRSGKK